MPSLSRARVFARRRWLSWKFNEKHGIVAISFPSYRPSPIDCRNRSVFSAKTSRQILRRGIEKGKSCRESTDISDLISLQISIHPSTREFELDNRINSDGSSENRLTDGEARNRLTKTSKQFSRFFDLGKKGSVNRICRGKKIRGKRRNGKSYIEFVEKKETSLGGFRWEDKSFRGIGFKGGKTRLTETGSLNRDQLAAAFYFFRRVYLQPKLPRTVLFFRRFPRSFY